MKKRICSVFVFDGFADHEVALTMACLNTESDFTIETFSDRGRSVTSLSGLRITPHTSLQNTDPEYFDLLLLPGGAQWEKGDNLEVLPLIRATAGRKPIAAICGATLALGDLGLLDKIPHTSNFPGYIEQYCRDYEGSDYYRPVSLVNAGDIITASGEANLDLAYEILRIFGIFEPAFYEQ
ncbi:MAG TPA: DJ-1/PfpI family protein [Puia sp.]|nr:DJ-1/PfpI family protein [Puia sp.]